MLAPEIPGREQLRLSTLRNLNILDTAAEDRFDRITRITQRAFNVPIVAVSLVDEDRQWFKSDVGLSEMGVSELPREISFCGHTILNNHTLVVPDTLLDPRFADNPLVADEPRARFYAGHPITAINGQRLGTLCIVDQKPRSFDEEDQRLLSELAQLAENEINSPDLRKLTRKLIRSELQVKAALNTLKLEEKRIRLLNKTLEMIAQGEKLPETLQSIIANIEAVRPNTCCYFQLYDESDNSLSLTASAGLPESFISLLDKVVVKDCLGSCSTSAFRRERTITRNVPQHPYWETFQDKVVAAGIASCWSEPVLDADGKVLGIFTIVDRLDHDPDEESIKIIEQTAYVMAIAIERYKNDLIIHQQANYDALTNLPNRNLLKERFKREIEQANRDQHRVALLYLDLDHFKETNDTLGHHLGDQLLIEVASRLSTTIRKVDTVARVGGDEFIVVMGRIEDKNDVKRIATQLVNNLSQPFEIEDQTVMISTSIGITFYPEDGDNLANLSQLADQAMYEAKKEGRNQFQYFSND